MIFLLQEQHFFFTLMLKAKIGLAMSPVHGTQLNTLLLQTVSNYPAPNCPVVPGTGWQYGCITPDKLLPPAGVSNQQLEQGLKSWLILASHPKEGQIITL